MTTMTNEIIIKSLEIIENKKDKEILTEISALLDNFIQPLSDIQIGKLILNDIEYPTEYSKANQSKIELISRYNNIIDIYYNIKKKQIEIQLKDNEIDLEKDLLKKQLINLEKEKLTLQIHSEKARLNAILKEINLYYKYYIKYNNGTDKLSENDKSKLEEDFWRKKALNNPVEFEERYGSYLKETIGIDKYNKYLTERKLRYGLLPREMIS